MFYWVKHSICMWKLNFSVNMLLEVWSAKYAQFCASWILDLHCSSASFSNVFKSVFIFYDGSILLKSWLPWPTPANKSCENGIIRWYFSIRPTSAANSAWLAVPMISQPWMIKRNLMYCGRIACRPTTTKPDKTNPLTELPSMPDYIHIIR